MWYFIVKIFLLAYLTAGFDMDFFLNILHVVSFHSERNRKFSALGTGLSPLNESEKPTTRWMLTSVRLSGFQNQRLQR
jgi:hypothetical protein